tara:strand:+ start:277 stop:564 length:288 start_codon:yes stop_codon:yes gene_type:complete
MLTEPLPISVFVKTRFSDPVIAATTDKWRVEGSVIEKIVINHFEDMGIYSVNVGQEHGCLATLMSILYNSPEIYQMVEKARVAEQRRKQSRHFNS